MMRSLAFEISLITNKSINCNYHIPQLNWNQRDAIFEDHRLSPSSINSLRHRSWNTFISGIDREVVNSSVFECVLLIIYLLMDEDEYDYGGYNNDEYGSGEPREEEDPQVPVSFDQVYSHDAMNEELPFEIIPLSNLYAELAAILEELQGLVYLDKGWCLVLLRQFKWDKDYLKEQYYNDNEEYLRRAGFKPTLDSPTGFDRGVTGICEVCCNEGVAIYYNVCGHNYCLECWVGHLKSCIQGGSAFPRCMDESCPHPVLLQTIEGLLRLDEGEGKQWLKKFEKKLCEMFITTNRNYQFCTGVDCGNCIKVNTQLDTVVCTCGKVFCFRCQSDDHYPCTCQEKRKWVEQVISEEADAKWISQNAKICPWCKKAVERSMGCNFMACTCGKSFCYMCSKPWEPDHKDHFNCHIYKAKPDDQLNREKEVMQRMSHCTERYIYNQAVANNYKQIDVFAQRKYLFKTLHISLTDSEFMEGAYRFAIECAEKLKWIYAFTFFHNFMKRKEAFEFSMGEYEKYKQNLLKLLAVDLKQITSKADAHQKQGTLTAPRIESIVEQFRGLKKQIVNYYTCTRSFKEKFVEEMMRVTEEMNNEKEKEEMKAYIEKNPGLVVKKTKSREEPKEKPEEKKEKKEKGLLGSLFGGRKSKK